MAFEENKSEALEEKLGKFGEKIIDLCKVCLKDEVSLVVIKQLTRSGTSIGANYMEANGASSKKDFNNKIFICKKESKETLHWLRMLAKSDASKAPECRILWQECKGYAKLFSSIAYGLKNKKQEIKNE